MKTRVWIVETDKYGMTDSKFFVDDPAYIPRIGEFVDGHKASGWVDHVQWNYSNYGSDNQRSADASTVYVYLKEKKNG